MDYVCIGKLVNTHGIKGEVRIISDFELKTRVFIPGNKLYIGKNKEELTIKTYRKHKSFDMCLFEEYNYINDVLKFKGSLVYVTRDSLDIKESEYLENDLIGFEAIYEDTKIGVIKDIINNNGYKLLAINDKYVPFNKEFITKVDVKAKKIELKNLEGII